jgi:hypothetical protein
MSWVEFFGRPWPVSEQTAEFHLHLWPPGAGCPRQSWTWNLFHVFHGKKKEDGSEERSSFLSVEIGDLFCDLRDWRRLAGLEVRADAKWHEQHEHTNEYGRMESGEVHVDALFPPGVMGPDGKPRANWVAHDYILRVGRLDGIVFPCELDAWVIPREEYYRKEPETAAELARFAEGPPNLRVLAGAVFTRGIVCVPRCNEDPVRVARRYLREEIGLEEIFEPKMEWASRRMPGKKESERVEGSSARVEFRCQPRVETAKQG